MKTRLKLFDGRKVVIEQTITSIRAHFEGESEPRNITSSEYMRLVWQGTPCGAII